MDDPALDAEVYAAVLGDLAKVNTITGARRPTLDFLGRAIGRRVEFSLLDVGFGDGDMLRAIVRWARERGKSARLVGIDLNPRSEPIARAKTRIGESIEYRTGDYADLAGKGFDCVISSLVAHHMTRQQLVAFVRFMESQATEGWYVNDLHRHGVAYVGYPILARMAGWHPIVRQDGRLSIARSYRPEEWTPILAEAGVEAARVERRFPFRLCVERLK
ncbi:2-polyprenyl-3-methyl-5-hydroxy-6-metoxy-1,4-benzoquinol methylase [Sphingobium sp. OAS761]|uniref:methyltransferase domain-containing protein n=1 Tax=Sphingobium sp. OAS761 TaxID=2817901 RepID=UPI0020A14F52|nr:methyltransferase domain-containing protein [Sphingobium sp. OAS761]MCP1469502.1 2-polyprenyl-3-methyl-5-hydroxy-6-metoxy-1,4-benzoquinol methylase [Sphingobium sp. OAS761]